MTIDAVASLPFVPPAAPPARLHLPDRRDLWLPAAADLERPLALPEVRRPVHPEIRARLRTDLCGWAEHYCAPHFHDPCTFHRKLAAKVQGMVLSATPFQLRVAVGAPRGIGKTTLFILAMLWAALYRAVRYGLILCATGTEAEQRLAALKGLVLTNELLAEDFPELCWPIRDFGGDPRRAPALYPWGGKCVRLPNGVWIEAHGMDGAVAGALQDFARPDLILLDDAETLDGARSETQCAALVNRINQEVLPLAPRNEHSAIAYLCTVRAAGCVGDQLTDQAVCPTWHGERWPALLKEPDRKDLWQAFLNLMRPGQEEGPRAADISDAVPLTSATPEAAAAGLRLDIEAWGKLHVHEQNALRWYAANKAAMDAGGETIDSLRLPLLLVQFERGRTTDSAWLAEYQQAPVKVEASGRRLTATWLDARRLPQYPVGQVPEWADLILATIDMGVYRLYWELDAWSFSRECSVVIEAGFEPTGLGDDGAYRLSTDLSVRASLLERGQTAALEALKAHLMSGRPRVRNGQTEILLPWVGVDVGGQADQSAWDRLVIEFCSSTPRWQGLKGTRWDESHRKRAGERNVAWSERCFWETNADHFKSQLFLSLQRSLVPPAAESVPAVAVPQASSLPLLKPDFCPLALGARAVAALINPAYLRQQAAEVCDARGHWEKPENSSTPNHWWDTAYMQFALLEIVRTRQTNPRPARYGVVGRAFA